MPSRSISTTLSVLALGSLLAGCGQLGGYDRPHVAAAETPLSAPTTAVQSRPLGGSASGGTIGNGPVKVGLILPLSQGGAPSSIGQSLRNAAERA